MRSQEFMVNFLQNELLTRQQLFKTLVDEKRDIDKECGYPSEVTLQMYQNYFERHGVAQRVVTLWPDACWEMEPEINENEEADETEWEKTFSDLNDEFDVLGTLNTLDVMSGIGHYGILLIGLDDGKELTEPVDGYDLNEPNVSELGNVQERKLTYLRPFSETNVTIDRFETDPKSKRFGLPVIYSIEFQDITSGSSMSPEKVSKKVHWTRVLHVAENLTSSRVFGTPRMKAVFNRLYDLAKLCGGSAEMFWQGAFPGYALEVDPEAELLQADKEELKSEMEKYSNSLQRYLTLQGMKVKSLTPQIADPRGNYETTIKDICIALNVPYRIFMGTEEAKLAGGQDSEAWNKRVDKRRERYVGPKIVRACVDKFIRLGVLRFAEYSLSWPDLSTPSEEQQASVAEKQTNALSKYVGGSVDQIIPPHEFLVHVMKFNDEEAQAIMDALEEHVAEEELKAAEEEEAMRAQRDADIAAGVDPDTRMPLPPPNAAPPPPQSPPPPAKPAAKPVPAK